MNYLNMSRRNFLKSIGFSATTLAAYSSLTGCHWQKSNVNDKTGPGPNVVMIYLDDLNEYQLGCYGGDVYTPHMNSLAEQGIRFTRAYVTTSICTPSRYGLITGQYPSRCSHPDYIKEFPEKVQTEVRFNTSVNPDSLNLAKAMKKAGYVTGCVGKWDFGSPVPDSPHALEVFPSTDGWTKAADEVDIKDPKISALLKRNHNKLCSHAQRLGFDYAHALYRLNMEFWNHSLNIHNMEWVTDAAMKFIDKNKEQPFFLYMAPTLHHIPHPQESMLQADPKITMAGYLDVAPNVQPPRDTIIPRVKAAGYKPESAYCTWLDDGIGAVINLLKKHDLYDNTIVILMSDHQSRDKCSLYEGGVRTPCIIRYPKSVLAGQVSDNLMQNIDIAPTIFDMCDISPSANMAMDGRSVVSLLKGDEKPVHESLYFEYGWTRAVCTKRWKYLALRYSKKADKLKEQSGKRLYHDKQLEPMQHNVLLNHPNYWDADQLYDLTIDADETTNLAHDPKHQEVLKEMKNRLSAYVKSLGSHPFGEF
ncbi:MAG: sulfatase-like hydrolase/transferase [Phycisphaerae bacterium]|nr:sulfatase-like hydrolase/transferase [Phycisphaerae bacterium]